MKKKLLAMLCAFGCIMAFAGCNTTAGTSDSSTPDGSVPDSTPTCNHTYDNACDTDCNVCGEERTPAEHAYDNACDADCNVCGEERTPANHVYDNACDTDCNVCGEERTPAEHAYDNACDADCNVCGEERTPANHVYDNEGDKNCNECGDERELNKYTVTFDVDGGSAIETQTVEHGTSASELANFTSTKLGYEFVGWTMADGSAIPDGATVTGDITVKAAWNLITYSAKIVRADGDEETVEFTVENRAAKLAEIALTANDAQYTYSWTADLPSELALNNDQVFTEKREVNNYMVAFDVDGGSAVETQTVEYGTPASELANFTSTKLGYEFAGWTMADGSAIPEGATVTGDITVKAVWVPSANTAYNVEIYLEELSGYSAMATQTIAQTGTTGETAEIDYDWMAANELTIPEGYSLDTAKSIFSGAIAADGSLVLKVYLKLNEYTVTVNGVSSSAKHGTKLSLPADPVQDGYIFKEWQVEGVKVDETYVITNTITVDAVWYVDLTAISLFEMDLSSDDDYELDTTAIGKVTAISINGESIAIGSSDASSVTIANDAVKAVVLTGGEYSNLILTTDDAEYAVKFTAVTQYLNADNIKSFADLKSTIEADMNGYYILTGNIDLATAGSNSQRASQAIGFGSLSGQTHTGSTEFNGTLDGRGYAIQNLEYNWRNGLTNHDYAFIDVIGAKGVVKNLALTNVQLKTSSASARVAGLAWTNKGTIENCYIDFTNNAGTSGSNAQWGQAALVLINDGTLQDCFVKLNITVDLGSNVISLVTANNGTMNNVNGVASVVGDGDGVTCFSPNGTMANCGCYATATDFFTANFDENYTSSYWTFDEETSTVKFGEFVVCAPAVVEMDTEIELDKSASKALNLDIFSLSGSVRSVKVNEETVEYSIADNMLTVAYSELASYTGVQVLTVDMGAKIYQYPLIMVTKYLNADNIKSFADLKSTLEADMNGYYVLTGNINLTAAGNNSQRVTRAIGYNGAEFNGTIDGRGFAIQNMEYNWRSDGGNHDHALFQTIGANGVVKNLALTGITVKTASARAAGLAIDNKGTVENCFVEYNATAGVSGSNSQWGQAALILKNNGAVKDCLVKLTISTDLGANYICLVTDNNGTIDNVNGIVSVVGDGDVGTTNTGSGSKANCTNLTSAADFYTNDCDVNYTSSYWTFDETNTTIAFGGSVVIS